MVAEGSPDELKGQLRGDAIQVELLQALEAGGVRVASVTIARPSLDDVYLRHTGRSLARTEETV